MTLCQVIKTSEKRLVLQVKSQERKNHSKSSAPSPLPNRSVEKLSLIRKFSVKSFAHINQEIGCLSTKSLFTEYFPIRYFSHYVTFSTDEKWHFTYFLGKQDHIICSVILTLNFYILRNTSLLESNFLCNV